MLMDTPEDTMTPPNDLITRLSAAITHREDTARAAQWTASTRDEIVGHVKAQLEYVDRTKTLIDWWYPNVTGGYVRPDWHRIAEVATDNALIDFEPGSDAQEALGTVLALCTALRDLISEWRAAEARRVEAVRTRERFGEVHAVSAGALLDALKIIARALGIGTGEDTP